MQQLSLIHILYKQLEIIQLSVYTWLSSENYKTHSTKLGLLWYSIHFKNRLSTHDPKLVVYETLATSILIYASNISEISVKGWEPDESVWKEDLDKI